MNTRALWTGLAGLGLLVVAGLMVPWPRPNPRPALPELPPFAAGERVALLWDAPELPPDVLALVQRAHAAGAIVRVAGPQESLADFAPTRCYRPAPWPEQPTGFHPDQWPHIPRGADTNGLQMLVLTPAELAAKNTAVLAAARRFHATGTDDAAGTREARLLAHARRAELYLLLPPPVP
ncbi:MAG TPA: hypothetical protein PLT12_10120 [Kiritimatiellia bacterium]|jgi:hypothetical protein|nr:hypothetical protein [Kiritimatiellia bacterium]HOR75224.1 hypothetical protein [Kiritimatiellia bacterium]HOU59950.1 hypothetical protein [Kiritimatiellia bacterium]HPK70206.1 hypothetical protein [Kiritimatiellia bacterium]HQK45224.1 hypothetical protein [Kiritimatiellia bacterium]